MKLLGKAIKLLPKYLQDFILTLSENDLGDNLENIQFIGEGMKQLPSNLIHLKLDLSKNKLG